MWMFPAVRALLVVSSAVMAATITTSVVLGIERDVDVDTPALPRDMAPPDTIARRSTSWSQILGRQPPAEMSVDGRWRLTADLDRDPGLAAPMLTVPVMSGSTVVTGPPAAVPAPTATGAVPTTITSTITTTITSGAPMPTAPPPTASTVVPATSVPEATVPTTLTPATTTAITTVATTTTTTTIAPRPAPFTETYQSAGGSITVSWDGSTLTLVAVQPAERHEAQVQEATATKVQVRFRGHPSTRISVSIAGGAVKVDIKDH